MSKDKVLERKVFFAGQKIFSEGEQGDRAYLIQDGTIEILKRQPDGGEALLAVVGKGELLGEMALVDDQPRMASARAQSDVSVIIINRATFADKLAKADPFIRGLLTMFVRNIRNLQQRK